MTAGWPRRRIAAHEAAHAVAVHVLGFHVTRIEVKGAGDFHTGTTAHDPLNDDRAQIMVSLAGREGERLLYAPPPLPKFSGTADADKALRAACRLSGADRVLGAAEIGVQLLLRDHLDLLKRVADRLCEVDVLEEAELASLLLPAAESKEEPCSA